MDEQHVADDVAQEPKKRHTKTEHIIGASLLGLLLIVAIMIGTSGGDDDERFVEASHLAACQESVARELANPGTADFDVSSLSIQSTRISGVVSAQNKLGMESDLPFVCTFSDNAVVDVTVG